MQPSVASIVNEALSVAVERDARARRRKHIDGRSFGQAIRVVKEILGSRGAWPFQHLGPGCLAHRLKNSEPGFPVSHSHDWHEPGYRLAVTGEHDLVAILGAAHKLGKVGFGIAY